MKKARARPRRIPAFGEWNYDHDGYGYAYGDANWTVTQYFDSAMQAGLVMDLPPSPSLKPAKKVVKWSDSASLTLEVENEQKHKVVVGLGDYGMKKLVKQSRVADAGAHTTTANYHQKACSRVAVKAVDEDLYEIPPDMLCHKPRKRLTKSWWIGGCLGLSCIA